MLGSSNKWKWQKDKKKKLKGSTLFNWRECSASNKKKKYFFTFLDFTPLPPQKFPFTLPLLVLIRAPYN